MTDEQMEDLVERIIQRLRPPVLVMVTAAAGYRHAIRQRLAGCGSACTWRWIAGRREQWQAIGETLPAATGNSAAFGLVWRCCCRFSTIRWRRIW
jgi:trehalose utilization protein